MRIYDKLIPKTSLLLKLLIIFSIVIVSLGFAAEENVSFEKFISQFTPEQQTKADSIWRKIGEDYRKGVIKHPAIAEEKISDQELFADLRIENKEQFLAELKNVRRRLSLSVESLESAEEEYIKWKTFGEWLKDDPAMGVVYLKSLKVRDQYESRFGDAGETVTALKKNIQEIRVNAALSDVSINFTYKDWIVIVFYLIFTTILGGVLSGKQASIKDFFLGGRKLAWPAVSGSIIATELSAATFLIAPAIVFSKGGDMTYIQLAFGTIVARFIIGYFFIPAFYEREIYSPYDYMGNQLGPRVKNITTILFMVGGILAQGARVYIAAKALQVITGTDITTSIIIIGVVAIGWTVMGGITTVIWTDAIQFVLFTAGAVAAIIFVHYAVDGGIMTVISEGVRAGKFNVINADFNAKEAYTIWCGLFATGFLTLGSHGTDQMMAQRMFTCKNQDEARKAILWSSLSQALTYLLLFVGASIFVYYKYLPLNSAEQVIVNDDSMKIFAIYIVNVMPPILSGLLMAALFATAISTLDSILAALSQSTISILYKPYIKPEASDKHYVSASRVIVLLWGIFLTAFAIFSDVIARSFADLIQFALAMAAYTYGALLGTFLLAFLPTGRDDMGLMWGVPLSMLIVFAFNWHQTIPQIIVLLVSFILIVQAFRHFREQPLKILYVGIGIGLVMLVSMAVVGTAPDGTPQHIYLAWPWHFPIGTAMTFIIGYFVGNRKENPSYS